MLFLDKCLGYIFVIENIISYRPQDLTSLCFSLSLLFLTYPDISIIFVHIITARFRRMGEGTVFSLFVSSHLDGGSTPARSGWWGGVPRPGLDGGGYPGQVWMVGGTLARSGWWGVPQQGLDGWGVPWTGLDGGRVPQPGLDGGGYPNQVCMVGGTLARSGWSGLPREPPPPARSGWWGYLG